MADIPRQRAGEPRIVEVDVAPLVDAKARALIEAEGARMIIGRGVHPQPPRHAEPPGVDRRLQEMETQPLADEIGQQAEIAQLSIASGGTLQLEIPGRDAARIEDEDL